LTFKKGVEEKVMGPRELIIITALLFVICVATGALLSNLKKARNNFVLTIHKISCLLSIFFTAWTIYQLTGGKW
jgi:hypothetical protein